MFPLRQGGDLIADCLSNVMTLVRLHLSSHLEKAGSAALGDNSLDNSNSPKQVDLSKKYEL